MFVTISWTAYFAAMAKVPLLLCISIARNGGPLVVARLAQLPPSTPRTGSALLLSETCDQAFSIHGATMILWCASPSLSGFGNYLGGCDDRCEGHGVAQKEVDMRRKPSSSPSFDDSAVMEKAPGISNRESASEESAERAAHPPLDTGPPPPVDAAGRTGEQPTDTHSALQMSGKAGSHSTAQKETGSRYTDRATPASKKVPGAFGKEPTDEPPGTESAAVMRDAVPIPEPAESRLNRIAKRAHEIYQARGGQHGKALEDWLAAEREIDEQIDRSLQGVK